MYIYSLPHQERKKLCKILDRNNKWEELGSFMNFDTMILESINRELFFGRGNSPTDELLTIWGHKSHTILELFILLSRMHHYQSMIVLKPFVDCQYYNLIYNGEHNFKNLIQGLR